MPTLLLKNRARGALLPSWTLSKIERTALWIVLLVFVADSFLVIYFIKFLFFSTVPISYAQTIVLGAKTGPATDKFIQELKTAGGNPVPQQKITRPPFSVPGRIVTLAGDNIQVFEYQSPDLAFQETSLIASKYAAARESHWSTDVHLYHKGPLAIFYLGQNQKILAVLAGSAGPALTTLKISSLAEH